MKVRGLQFPTFVAARPNKRRPWLDLMYVGKLTGGKYYYSIFAMSRGWGKPSLTRMDFGDNMSKSYMSSPDRFPVNELHEEVKRDFIMGIFINDEGIQKALDKWENHEYRQV